MRYPRCSRILLALFPLVWTTCARPAGRQTELDARVNELLAKMTLEEKVGQLNLPGLDKTDVESLIAAGKAGAVLAALGAEQTNRLQRVAVERSRLHIPLLFGYDVIHGYRTIFPIPLGLASTWDPGAVEISGADFSPRGQRQRRPLDVLSHGGYRSRPALGTHR